MCRTLPNADSSLRRLTTLNIFLISVLLLINYIGAEAKSNADTVSGKSSHGIARSKNPIHDNVSSSDFATLFRDSTLRVDYVFGSAPADSVSGRTKPIVLLKSTSMRKGWAGRRHDLNRPLLQGHGRIIMTDPISGDTLYVHPFSSLFNEWLSLPELSATPQAFQQTFLLPMPRSNVEITIQINDMRRRPIARFTHRYSPDDILTRPLNRHLAENAPEVRILHPGSSGNPINVAILAEGYSREESEQFFSDASTAVEEILSYEPFLSNSDRFTFTAVASPSVESGVSIPKENDWRDTAFGSHFSTFYTDRYLTTPEVWRLHDALSDIPYEHIIVLANTDEYGGGGIFNSYMLIAVRQEDFLPTVVHEFGHSFGGLADEYFSDKPGVCNYPLDVEPWEPNITTLTDFPAKWQDIIPADTPIPTPPEKAAEYPTGIYEGAAYQATGIYRPANECRMRNNTYPDFCPTCRRALLRQILHQSE